MGGVDNGREGEWRSAGFVLLLGWVRGGRHPGGALLGGVHLTRERGSDECRYPGRLKIEVCELD